MGNIADSLESELKRIGFNSFYEILKIYERSYPVDLSLETISDGGSIMDFETQAGDISLVGFFYYNNNNRVIKRGLQDLILRLLISQGDIVFYPNFGIETPLTQIHPDLIQAVVQVAASSSPYIDNISNVSVEQTADDAYRVTITGNYVTGERIAEAFTVQE